MRRARDTDAHRAGQVEEFGTVRFPIPTKPRRDTDYAFGRKLERCVRWQEVRARVPSHPSMGAVRHVAHRCKALQV